MEHAQELPLFLLGETHSIAPAGLALCADFVKDPPRAGIRYKEAPDGRLILYGIGSNASADLPPGTWKRLV